jgi:hypothetical protein
VVIDLLDYVGEGNMVLDGDTCIRNLAGNYPGVCRLRFPEVYAGDQMWQPMKTALDKKANQEGFQLVAYKKKSDDKKKPDDEEEVGDVHMVYTMSCSRKHLYRENECMPDYQPATKQSPVGHFAVGVKKI